MQQGFVLSSLCVVSSYHYVTSPSYVSIRRRSSNALASRSPPCRASVMSCECTVGLFRPTRKALIPPQLAKFLVTATAILLESLYKVYKKESSKPAQKSSREEKEDSSSSFFNSHNSGHKMTEQEAIQILGLELVNPRLLEDARISKYPQLPLSNTRDREIAKRNFDRMFLIASKHNNMYLAGKLSAAYRLCVDPNWDDTMDGNK